MADQQSSNQVNSSTNQPSTSSIGLVIFAWLWVGLPLAWGVLQTFNKTLELFK